MKPIDTTPAGQNEFLSFDFELQHPPEKVWRALTNPVLLAEWLLPVIDYELVKGKTFTFKSQPMPGWDGLVHAKFLEIEARSKLAYAWKVGELETTVTFELAATPTGTKVKLVQSGFKEHQKQNWGGARYGWRMMGEKLFNVLSTMGEES